MARPRRGAEIGASEGVALRITPELRAALDHLAASHGRTITQELRVALEEHVERHTRKNGHARSKTNGDQVAQECEAVRDAIS